MLMNGIWLHGFVLIPSSLPLLCAASSLLSFPFLRRQFPSSIACCCSSSRRRAMSRVLESIEINDLERKIFDTLISTLSHCHLSTQLRVAGGWVRDKLLGKECYDIDIAVDNMLGREFCEKVNEYLQTIGEETHGISVIQSNPEQSKHLETARMRMSGVWIDFVNLRTECYAENSRIPSMDFGTAEMDAYRRDLTINSLFYNINTGAIEDFTGQGISDLKAGIIATPLPAKQTFLDDPLRVLRAIRFGARLNYELDKDLKSAASDPDVKAALSTKVSRERIGHEVKNHRNIKVDLMISSNYPVKAIKELANLQLFWIVFSLPSDLEPLGTEEMKRLCTETLDTAWELLIRFDASKLTVEQRRIFLVAALLLPFRSYHCNRKKKKVPISTIIIRESLKFKANDADTVVALHKSAEEFLGIKEVLLSEKESDNEICIDHRGECEDSIRSKQVIAVGLVLMEIKERWRLALLLSSLFRQPAADADSMPSLNAIFAQCTAIEGAIIRLGLEKVWERKLLLDGKVIMAELGLASGGPIVKEWQDRILRWQLVHSTGTLEECLEWFRREHVKRLRSN